MAQPSHQPAQPALFRVIDTQSQRQVGKVYSDVRRARARRDALDTRYGAVRYAVQQVTA